MAGSPEYLELLDFIEAHHSTAPLPRPVTWDLLDEGWNLVALDPTSEGALIGLAHIALTIYAQEREVSFADVILTSKTTHIKKNRGYAGESEDPWANFRMSETFGISAHMGVLVRMSDKFIRISNLRINPDNDQVGESILDTLIDLAAYALIAVCLLREQKRSLLN